MSADVIDIHKASIGAELAWTTDTEELSDRVVLSKHYNGKYRQSYGILRNTCYVRQRIIGIWVPPLKRVSSKYYQLENIYGPHDDANMRERRETPFSHFCIVVRDLC